MADIPDLQRRRFVLGRLSERSEPAPPPVAAITSSCFAFQGIACMSCRDACSSGAVRFELARGGARPRVDAALCTGCGACSESCPADAIHLHSPEEAA